jgi:hypothetical protein
MSGWRVVNNLDSTTQATKPTLSIKGQLAIHRVIVPQKQRMHRGLPAATLAPRMVVSLSRGNITAVQSYTMTTFSPTPISSSKSFKISVPLRLGYSKRMPSNLTVPRRVGASSIPTSGGTAGRLSRRSKMRAPAPIPRMIEDLTHGLA